MINIRNHQFVKTFDPRALELLRSSLSGQVILPDSPEYDPVRKIWNGMIDRYPAIIARCKDSNDVIQAIRFGRDQNLDIAIRGGGHNISGLSTCEDGLMIDLSLMKDVLVDPQRRTARVSAGLTLGEMMQATQVYGLATTTGTVSGTGVAGLTLGGGIGWLMSKYGLACDNVISFEMVTADGDVVRANAAENPDLYWGLKGGGGNLGVVTTFEFQLHPVARVLGGMVIHPMSRAREVLRFYRDFADHSPDELSVYAALITTSNGLPAVAMVPCYFGNLEEGERILSPLRKFGQPIMDMIRPMTYSEMVTIIDNTSPDGRKYYLKGCTVPQLTDEALDLLIEAGEAMTSPFTLVLIQHVHGAAARIAPTETAFSARGASYMPVFQAAWEEDPAEPHINWARQAWTALKPLSVDATYVNFMSAEDINQVASAYASNYTRLVGLKKLYDPENVFHVNINIKPK
jgi:FAD/FMN-containing dehydrogenase